MDLLRVRLFMRTGTMSIFLGVGCANWGQTHHEEPVTIKAMNQEDAPLVAEFTAQDGLAAYRIKTSVGASVAEAAEWIACTGQGARGTVLVMHDRVGFDHKDFCTHWLAQTFLSQGLSVLAVNRPGSGQSSGSQDFIGPASLAAMQAGITDAQSKVSLPRLMGCYGYGVGAAAAALVAKRLGGLDFLILGGGVYDLEDTWQKSSDQVLKSEIAMLRKDQGDQAMEERSIAYDVAGLPSKIMIYHGNLDSTVPSSQAKAFRDSLESSGEYKVSLQLIEGLAHDIPPRHHRHILEALVVSTLREAHI